MGIPPLPVIVLFGGFVLTVLGFVAALQKSDKTEDESMKRFNEALRAFAYPRDNRVQSRAAPRYNVTATMTGRVDDAGATRSGFGHLGGYRIRFVLSSVEDVSTEEREVADSPSR